MGVSFADVIMVWEQGFYRFCDRRLRHQRRLEVEGAFRIFHHECTAIACIALDGHGTVQGIRIREIQGYSCCSVAIP